MRSCSCAGRTGKQRPCRSSYPCCTGRRSTPRSGHTAITLSLLLLLLLLWPDTHVLARQVLNRYCHAAATSLPGACTASPPCHHTKQATHMDLSSKEALSLLLLLMSCGLPY